APKRPLPSGKAWVNFVAGESNQMRRSEDVLAKHIVERNSRMNNEIDLFLSLIDFIAPVAFTKCCGRYLVRTLHTESCVDGSCYSCRFVDCMCGLDSETTIHELTTN